MKEKPLGVSDSSDSIADEFFALLDSIDAQYILYTGEVIVVARDGSVWLFTEPVKLREAQE